MQAASPIEAMRQLDKMPEIEKTSVFGTAVHAVLRSDSRIDLQSLADRLRSAGVTIDAIAPVQPSLEDVFLEVVERGVGVAGAQA